MRIFRRAGDNLLNLVNDILDLSKVEASQLELEQTGFALPDLLEKVTELVAGRAQEKGLALSCEIAPGVPGDILGDQTRLQQVLLNLLGNAIKFTESGAVSLRISVEEDSGSPAMLRFTVVDSGIGIPEENLGRVFERFTQADSSTTRRFGGSGLGLTISKRLVELMGGRIWAESTVDQGSVFCFVVPLVLWEETRGARASSGVRHGPPLPALRILLVEDSADNCVITVAYLANTPYVIAIAENGLSPARCSRPDSTIILMDRRMPVMDGVTATDDPGAGEGAPPAHADHRPYGLGPEGRPGAVPGGGVHRVPDEADQARAAAPGAQGRRPRRAGLGASGAHARPGRGPAGQPHRGRARSAVPAEPAQGHRHDARCPRAR